MRTVIDAARVLGWEVYHTHDSRRSVPGYPDLVLIRRDLQIVAELKRSRREKPTAEQTRWLKLYRGARVPAFLWTPEDWDDITRVLQYGPRLREGL